MTLTVLISCMYQKDASIIKRTNVQTDVVVVNQCDVDNIEEFNFLNKKGKKCHAKFISTIERGLSNSRNMAIKFSWGDICYFCDDDELLEDNYEEIIVSAHKRRSVDSIITFSLVRNNYSYPNVETKMGVRQILRTSSVQTTFKRNDILKKEIYFDPYLGSGSGNGGGEEIKFLMDSRRAGLGMYYIPTIIAIVKSENSQWFNGFTEKYFKDTFWGIRRIFGVLFGLVYLLYWCIIRSRHYAIDMSKWNMLRYSLIGFFEKRQ